MVDVFEPEDLLQLRNIPRVTKCLAQLSKLVSKRILEKKRTRELDRVRLLFYALERCLKSE